MQHSCTLFTMNHRLPRPDGALKQERRVARPMQAFRATGTFPNGKNIQPFSKDLVAADEVDARHRVYSFFGSRHGVNRRFVKIASLEQIEPTTSKEPAVISAFRDTHDFSTTASSGEE